MQVQIRFNKPGSSQLCGNFAPGDLFRCNEAQARHFVNDARCAVYVEAAHAQSVPPKKPRSQRKSAALTHP